MFFYLLLLLVIFFFLNNPVTTAAPSFSSLLARGMMSIYVLSSPFSIALSTRITYLSLCFCFSIHLFFVHIHHFNSLFTLLSILSLIRIHILPFFLLSNYTFTLFTRMFSSLSLHSLYLILIYQPQLHPSFLLLLL